MTTAKLMRAGLRLAVGVPHTGVATVRPCLKAIGRSGRSPSAMSEIQASRCTLAHSRAVLLRRIRTVHLPIPPAPRLGSPPLTAQSSSQGELFGSTKYMHSGVGESRHPRFLSEDKSI